MLLTEHKALHGNGKMAGSFYVNFVQTENMNDRSWLLKVAYIISFLICMAGVSAHAQDILSKRISFDVTNLRLPEVLKLISNKGNFYFSYNTTIIKRDSLVTLSATNKPVRQILDQLFGNNIEFQEYNNYIILRKVVAPATRVTQSAPVADKLYTVTGYVLNGETGEKVTNASIYEKQRLVSTLTNDQGFFTIKLKSRYSIATLTISRELFEDTTVVIQTKYNQQVTIVMEPVQVNHAVVTISPADFERPDSGFTIPATDSITAPIAVQKKSSQVEKTKFGQFLVSTQQRIQSINLSRFFADRPFQVSFIPGFGTHGKLSGQVINNFSLNVLGGYTGGTNGFEIGGLFNIVKRDAQYLQIGGIFNIVGGQVTGVQVGGINNTVLDGARGLQIGGINNFVRGKVTGWQMAGIHNHSGDSVSGVQLAGIANYARDKVGGAQIAGIANFSNRTISGVQLAGIFNYAKRLNGLQIGLINIADTSTGYSIGLINLIWKGYHKLVFSTNEAFTFNLAYKSGNKKLYSILLASANQKNNEKAYGLGYGFGTELGLGKKFTLNPELTAQYLYLGDFDYGNLLGRFQLQLNYKLTKFLSIYAGPAFSVYNSNQTAAVEGYKFPVSPSGYHTYELWNKTTGWIGWNAGISFF
jgi:hypothetical protein